MSMSRKDYVLVAAVLDATRKAYDEELEPKALDAIDNVASQLAFTFANDNDRFDRARFLEAAGVTTQEVS